MGCELLTHLVKVSIWPPNLLLKHGFDHINVLSTVLMQYHHFDVLFYLVSFYYKSVSVMLSAQRPCNLVNKARAMWY